MNTQIMDKQEIRSLELFAKKIRLNMIKSLFNLGFGHYGGSLSIVETLAVLYGKVMHIDPQNPNLVERDYFILSKGHAGPAYYAALALTGYFNLDRLYTLNQFGTKLPSHPDRRLTPGVDMTTGSLGQGISAACGVAKSFQMDRTKQYVYCIVGDGELNEGQCWEAFQFAAHNKLDHLIVFLDENKKQLDGPTHEVCQTYDYAEKLRAFGFDTQKVDGKSVEKIVMAVEEAKKTTGKPHIIILDTVKGQGFPYLEQKEDNHHVRPTENEKEIIRQFIEELEQKIGGDKDA
ncbi:MAG: hypothetical protein K0S71_1996 [Clostridia bacterium]|jgi:transketolase|nr:hypothetical protein [Clostridia bacterium]